MSAHIFANGGRVERVDEWHQDWPRVLDFIERNGKRQDLQLTPAGWVSARQSVIAAFVGKEVVGHLAFHIEPTCPHGTPPTLQAKIDACVIAEGYDAAVIRESLKAAAVEWAQRIHCDPEPVERLSVA